MLFCSLARYRIKKYIVYIHSLVCLYKNSPYRCFYYRIYILLIFIGEGGKLDNLEKKPLWHMRENNISNKVSSLNMTLAGARAFTTCPRKPP